MKDWNGKRGPKRRLSLEKVIAPNLLRFFLHIKDLKAFHKTIKITDMIPELPNYENFLKATNKALPIIALFMQILLSQKRMKNESDTHFIDSTPVSTCMNRRIYSHKVTSGFASRGKSTKRMVLWIQTSRSLLRERRSGVRHFHKRQYQWQQNDWDGFRVHERLFLFVQRGCWLLRRIFEKMQRPCQSCWSRTVYLRRRKAEYEQTYFWWTMESS